MSDQTSNSSPSKKGEAIATPRGPAYPYIPLGKAVERGEQLRDANMARVAASPLAIYKVWGWGGENGTSRQVMAALNHFGLLEYEGRGEARQVKLSELARRIVLDRVPDSKERAQALRAAALMPPIHQKLWDRFGAQLPPDVVVETFLMRDSGFNESGAKNLVGEYRATIEYAKLDMPDNMPPDKPEPEMEPESQSEAEPEPPKKGLSFLRGLKSPPTPAVAQKGQLMSGERELTAGLLSKEANFRLIVSGPVGVKEIERLIAKLEMDKEILAEADEDADNAAE